jgi:hypothetical protein
MKNANSLIEGFNIHLNPYMGRWISHNKISYTNGGIILHKWMWILFNVKGGTSQMNVAPIWAGGSHTKKYLTQMDVDFI